MAYLTPNTKFEISGQNMNLIDDIRFGDIFVEDLEYVSTTGVTGTVPINAFTSDVIAHTSHGQFSLGEQYIILTWDDQVTVGKLTNISGKAGSLYSVTGENFYQITNVKFGEVEASFNLVDPETVEAIVPQDADYDGVTVFSALRTGLNNKPTIARDSESMRARSRTVKIARRKICTGTLFLSLLRPVATKKHPKYFYKAKLSAYILH